VESVIARNHGLNAGVLAVFVKRHIEYLPSNTWLTSAKAEAELR
jgi:hypothetical protein